MQLASFMSELHSDGLLDEDGAAGAPSDSQPSASTATASTDAAEHQTASGAGTSLPSEQSTSNEKALNTGAPAMSSSVEPEDASDMENVSNPDFIGPAMPEGPAAEGISSLEAEPLGVEPPEASVTEPQSTPTEDPEISGQQHGQAVGVSTGSSEASTGPPEQRVICDLRHTHDSG